MQQLLKTILKRKLGCPWPWPPSCCLGHGSHGCHVGARRRGRQGCRSRRLEGARVPELLREQKCSGLLAPDFSGEREINSHLVSATVKR